VPEADGVRSAAFYGEHFGVTERLHEDDHLLILTQHREHEPAVPPLGDHPPADRHVLAAGLARLQPPLPRVAHPRQQRADDRQGGTPG
jgi:hypothetical protein